MNCEVLFERKLPCISAYNNLAADKYVNNAHTRAAKIQNKHYFHEQKRKWQNQYLVKNG